MPTAIDGELIIQKDGPVGTGIKTRDAEIIGKYEGSMKASGRVEIKETDIVNGSIKTDSLIVNEGGIFSGDVKRMSDYFEKGISKDYNFEPEENEASKNYLLICQISELNTTK